MGAAKAQIDEDIIKNYCSECGLPNEECTCPDWETLLEDDEE